MKKYLEKLPEELKSLIKRIRDVSRREKAKAYLVGGLVRDLLLEVKNLDLDVVIEGDGIKFAEAFALTLAAKFTPHRQFGTATVSLNPGQKIDFSSARKEFYPASAHLPIVESGSLNDDLFRRDLTINAMAIDLSNGKLVDYFGGRADLQHKIIRVLHTLSFVDDPTRILRAIRFEQRYDFKIEPKTLGLLKEAVKAGLLEKVHPHRLRDELIPIFKEKYPVKEIKRLEALTGFDFILPGLIASGHIYVFLRSIEKEIRWFKQKNSERRPLDTWLIYLMGLLGHLHRAEIRKICAKFGLRKGEEKRLLSFQQVKAKEIKDLSKAGVRPSRIYAILEPLSYETIIALRARHANVVFRRNLADFLEIYNGMRIFVCGEDLHCLGLLPGPHYQKIFAQVLNAKLNGRVKTKEEELSLIKQLSRKRSPSNGQAGKDS